MKVGLFDHFKGASRFNGGGGGGGGGLFFRLGGFIFKWGDAQWVGIGFDVGREFRKKGGVSPHAPHTMGNPAWGVTNFLV